MPEPYNIPAGFPYNFTVKISRSEIDKEQYSVITDASEIPSANWRLCLVNDEAISYLDKPLDWGAMDEHGAILISLSAEETLALAGKRLHMEVRNDAGTSNLANMPEQMFFFVPNNLH